jgi:hypothetical protein
MTTPKRYRWISLVIRSMLILPHKPIDALTQFTDREGRATPRLILLRMGRWHLGRLQPGEWLRFDATAPDPKRRFENAPTKTQG